MTNRSFSPAVLTLLAVLAPSAAAEPKLDLKPGDHISFIGNTLADRMQHDGWLETYLYSRFPKHELTIRNLGFSGDELTTRLRSASFGSPDEWLTRNRTDVVFAFFGYNESFAGPDGLAKFEQDLAAFIKQTLSQKYNGKAAPRLVLFSPIAHEDLKDRNLPDGVENNQRIEAYTAAMERVAGANGVAFVDLYRPSRELYGKASKPLTINGVHLTAAGNELLAEAIDRDLFAGLAEPKRDTETLEKIRQAVLDKNFHWFNRYRTTDGYSIYGGRADLKFTAGQTNREVAQREMEILDVMTANRDKRIWAVAQGGDLKVDDSNIPPFIPVVTNKPGSLPGGLHAFLDGDESIGKMTVARNVKVNLFASEQQFPELVNPVQMTFDAQGRLWVAVWPTYPHWKPTEPMNDKLLILEDTNGDGRADRCSTFADGLHNPTGFELWNGGVLIAQAPDLLFLKDTNGDGKADLRQRVLHGLDSADTHHTSNSFVLDAGGGLYFQEGTFHHTQVETPYGPPQRCANAGVFRYEPRTQKFDVYVTFGFANPHGHVFDRWGQDIVVDGTGALPYHAALFSGHLPFPQKHSRPPQVYQQRTRPCPGMEYLSSRHFPDEMQGHLLVANVIGFQGILRYKIEDKGGSFSGTEQEPLLSSTDPSFRPSDLKIGPDGAIYFLDWHNPIIGHMQHNLRDPSRDRNHGRVYRVTYEGRPLLKSPTIAGEPIAKLLELFNEPEERVRYRVRTELAARPTDQVLAGVKQWLAGLNPKDAEFEHHRLEALWIHQNHNVVNADLLRVVLASPDFRARAAATRVLSYWRDRVPEALDLLRTLAADPHPRVRLEAVRAASFFTVPEAAEIPVIAAEQPQDMYVDFVIGETKKVLDPILKKALDANQPIRFSTTAGGRYLIRNTPTEELLKMKRDTSVLHELLLRKGVRDEYRREAVTGLAKLQNKSEPVILIDALRGKDNLASGGRESPDAPDESVSFDLIRLLTGRRPQELGEIRQELEQLATQSARPVTRQLGYVALIEVDGGIDRAWALGTKSVAALRDLVEAMPLVRDPNQRAALYPKVEPLLHGLPKELPATAAARAVSGRFVRIELPGRQRTLTLAEVQVFSDGRNVARQGKAKQVSTANGGDAARAIDGNTSGKFEDRGQTHTAEGIDNAWWEVDLGAEFPIDSVVIWNRTDGNLSRRLNNFTLQVLDKGRAVVFEKKGIPAPDEKVALPVSGESPERVVRAAAMVALTSVRGQEGPTFKALARFLGSDADRPAAIGALLRIPASHCPPEEIRPVLNSLLGYIRQVPAADRTSQPVLDAMQLTESLAALLPLADAKTVRKELGELGVRVIRLMAPPEQMRYDQERIVVQAGKPVEIIFENTDLMPHNFVLVQPGALEEVGMLAETTATQPGAAERQYVPPSKKILIAGKLLLPREAQKLSYTAPTKPGVYPYVCTYPGHWRRMHGAMYVVADLDEYLADPEGYLAAHPLPIADELLKFNRPRKEWKLDELSPGLAQLGEGRSFTNGKLMFQIGACVSCHKLAGTGNEIGPDLTKLDPKWTPADILRDLVEPSFRINEKYQSFIFELNSGKVVTGLVLEETPTTVKVIENPLAKAEPLILKKADIAERAKSMTSAMPKGLLDKLTREEILDLMAYVLAAGDPKHRLFQGGHGH